MKKIIMSGEIGWGVTPYMIQSELQSAGGEDIEVDLSSPGGSVFDGVEIFNMLRDYKRQYPDTQNILNIKSLAASMGSYLSTSEAFDMVTVEDNSSYMIHNPVMGVYGDYNEMQKGADFLSRLAVMVAPAYSKKSGKKDKEIRSMMDAETWLFGQEIVDAGFADVLVKTEDRKDRDSALAEAELKFKSVMKKVKESEVKESDFLKVAAIIGKLETEPEKEPTQEPATSGKNNQEEKLMDINELKMKHPDIFAEAQKAGIDQEKERVKALVEMKKKKDFEGVTPILERIDEAIEKGESVNDVQMAVVAMSLKGGAVSAALDSNAIGNLGNNAGGTVSGEMTGTDFEDEGF